MSKELNTKIVNAMERIEQLVRMTDGKCYLSFSGGKDSTVVLTLIKMCQDIYTIRPYSIPAVYSETGLELGATSRFVRFIEDFISYYNVPLSEAYTEYHCKRTGCFLCPYSLNLEEDLSVLYYNEPNRYTAAIHWLKDVYIAQNVILPFDFAYERERIKKWVDEYDKMRYDMMLKYRPNIASKYSNCQLSLDF